jgi:hypothetical protein
MLSELQVECEKAGPHHYTTRELECWDWYEKAMTREEFVGAMKNNIWKYTYRAGNKEDAVGDLQKAITYIERWIRYLKEPAANEK